jgi:hypothetical protein
MRVWLDWDSGPYETVSKEPHTGAVEVDMSPQGYDTYMQVLESYVAWQNLLQKMRKNHAKE